MQYGYKPTTNGRRVITGCLAKEVPLRLTRVAVGNGQVEETVNLADVHELLGYVAEGAIAERRHEEDRLYLTVQYANNEHPEVETFYLSEFMVFAEDPDTGEETDLLYATLGDYIQPVPAYTTAMPASVFNYQLVLVVSDEINVEITASPGLVTFEDLTKYATKEDLAAYATKEELQTYVTTTAVQELVDQAIQDAGGSGGAIETAVENTFNRLVSEGVTVDRTEVTKIIKETISSGGGTYSGVMTLTIPAADWVAAETPTEEYAYTCDVEAPGVTAEHWPSGGPNHGSFTVAQEAGLLGGCETMDGYVRFFAKRIPTGDIQATIAVFAREKTSSGGTGADVATADTAGVVKPGNGMTVAEDGTLSLDLGGGLTYDETGKVTVDTVDEAAVQQEVSDILSTEDANP